MMQVKEGTVTWEITPGLVVQVVERIRAEFDPEQIVVFGSVARGTAKPSQSDLDVLVVMKTDLPSYRRSTPIRLLFRPSPCPMDIIVVTPEEVAQWKGVVNHIITDAFETGMVVYDKHP
jgi:predicted nucleotidyltransferase